MQFLLTDLSKADFRGCNFAEAMVCGASFNHAMMTGAIIDNWGMGKPTQFYASGRAAISLSKAWNAKTNR